jgi:PAS domain S-box-containing protein/putative nucleotidyltransferase with HDIG domain
MPGFMFANNKKASKEPKKKDLKPWHVLIVDDEESIHAITELVLGSFSFDNHPLRFLNAYSAKEAKEILKKEDEIALVLLDVVMESDNAGLELVKYIRNDLKNHTVRIVLRTGQPGLAPEEEVITSYDINDYKDKTELTNTKLKSTVYNAIKSYRDLKKLQDNADTLLKYKNMFDSATDFIFVVDKNSRILEANSAFLHAIGKEHGDTVGKPIFELFPHKGMKETLEENILQSMNGLNIHYISEMNFEMLGKRHMDIEFFPYYDQYHNLSAVVVNFQDITKEILQQKEAEVLRLKQIENYKQTIYTLVDMIERRDSYTAGHTKRVARYVVMIAKEMNLSDHDLDNLHKAAMLHDIGKIMTPDSVLLKPGKFNELEYTLIQDHLTNGYDILKGIDIYKELAEIMVLHHERYDGKGYPKGLKGDEISTLGHIMIVADAFDAMTTDRIYKKHKEIDEAFAEMISLKKKQFHPDVVDAALIALKDVKIDATTQLPKSSMEKARFAYFFKDPLTKVYNDNYLNTILSTKSESFKQIHFVELHNISQYNNSKSWQEGNKLIRSIAKVLQEIKPEYMIFRIHGDDFFILAQDDVAINIKEINSIDFIKDSGVELSVQSKNFKNKNLHTLEELELYFEL